MKRIKKDFNYLTHTELKRNFHIYSKRYAELVMSGKLRPVKRREKLVLPIEDVFRLFHTDSEVVIKKWRLATSDVHASWNNLRKIFKHYLWERCQLNRCHEEGVYRVYFHGRVLKCLVFIHNQNFMEILSYDKNINPDDMELIWNLFDK